MPMYVFMCGPLRRSLACAVACVAAPSTARRPRRPVAAVFALLFLVQVGTARAATHQVNTSSDWQSIVNNAVAGDVVEFADGTYTAVCSNPGASHEQNNQALSMLSITAGITLRAQNPGKAVLDAESVASSTECRVMYINAPLGTTVEINGLDITGGYADTPGNGNGGGVLNSGRGTVTFNSCDIYGNTAFSGGGVFFGNDGIATFNNCDIHGNTAYAGGGGVDVNGDDGTVTFNSCDIHNNTGGHWGGGVNVNKGTVTLTSCDIYGNTAYSGAALSMNSGVLVYVSSILPVSPGYYLANTFECIEVMCVNQTDPTAPKVPCPPQFQVCNYHMYAGNITTTRALLNPGGYNSWTGPSLPGLPTPCLAGYRGDSLAPATQKFPTCGGLCPPGS